MKVAFSVRQLRRMEELMMYRVFGSVEEGDEGGSM